MHWLILLFAALFEVMGCLAKSRWRLHRSSAIYGHTRRDGCERRTVGAPYGRGLRGLDWSPQWKFDVICGKTDVTLPEAPSTT